MTTLDRVTNTPQDLTQLVGVAEIAARLGVQANTVSIWRQRHQGFPEPVLRLSGVDIWYMPDVEEWAAIERPPGRPRKEAGPG